LTYVLALAGKRDCLPLGLRKRRRDAAVSPYFTEPARIGDLFPGGSLPHILELLASCRGASARSDQKRASVWLIHGSLFRSCRSAREAPALFSVGELIQDIQKEVASKNAKREKYGG
jgi:hypothetical protein